MTLSLDQRRRVDELKAEIRDIEATGHNPRKLRHKRVQPVGEGQRAPRQLDPDYLSAIHSEGLPCFACLCGAQPMPPVGMQNPIEAAHQKLAISSKGWKGSGKGRSSDFTCVPLCRWHHQVAPNACDKAQRKFWDRIRLGDDIANLCSDLYTAFKSSEPMRPVLERYAWYVAWGKLESRG